MILDKLLKAHQWTIGAAVYDGRFSRPIPFDSRFERRTLGYGGRHLYPTILSGRTYLMGISFLDLVFFTNEQINNILYEKCSINHRLDFRNSPSSTSCEVPFLSWTNVLL